MMGNIDAISVNDFPKTLRLWQTIMGRLPTRYDLLWARHLRRWNRELESYLP